MREDLGTGLEDEAGQVDRLTGGTVGRSSREDLDCEAGRKLGHGDRPRRGILCGQAWSEEAGEGDESEESGSRQSGSHRGSFHR
jgi:hypothetical protein